MKAILVAGLLSLIATEANAQTRAEPLACAVDADRQTTCVYEGTFADDVISIPVCKTTRERVTCSTEEFDLSADPEGSFGALTPQLCGAEKTKWGFSVKCLWVTLFTCEYQKFGDFWVCI